MLRYHAKRKVNTQLQDLLSKMGMEHVDDSTKVSVVYWGHDCSALVGESIVVC